MKRPTITAFEVPPTDTNGEFAEEWDTYRFRFQEWLKDGGRGRFVLIKGRTIVGFWDTEEEALGDGRERFPTERFVVHRLQPQEPQHRIGYCRIVRG